MITDNFHEDIIKLLLAFLFGSIIGAEREYRTKSAGFRTLILVTVGSTLFTIFSVRIGAPGSPDRIASNIVTGIGFLGAGAIFRAENRVNGVTTAAIIWIAAAIGMGVGSGEYILCGVATCMILIVLLLMSRFERVIDNLNQAKIYKITGEFNGEALYSYEDLFRRNNLSVKRVKQTMENGNIIGVWELQGSEKNHEAVSAELLKDEKIKAFEF